MNKYQEILNMFVKEMKTAMQNIHNTREELRGTLRSEVNVNKGVDEVLQGMKNAIRQLRTSGRFASSDHDLRIYFEIRTSEFYKFYKRLTKIDPANPDPKINVKENGPITFTYNGGIPRETDVYSRMFVTSNELVSGDFNATLEKLQGKFDLVGVLGGTDQVLELIGRLQKNCKLNDIRLYDTSKAQILFGIALMQVYNEDTKNGTIQNTRAFDRLFRYAEDRTELDSVHVSVHNRDIFDALKTTERGRKFVYLSNILTVPIFVPDPGFHYDRPYFTMLDEGWGIGYTKSRELLLEILENNNIETGSHIMLASKMGYATLLEKRGKGKDGFKIRALDYRYAVSEKKEQRIKGRLNEYLRSLQDREAWLDFFARNNVEFPVWPGQDGLLLKLKYKSDA